MLLILAGTCYISLTIYSIFSVGMQLEVNTTEQNAENQDGDSQAEMDIDNVIMKEPKEEQTDT